MRFIVDQGRCLQGLAEVAELRGDLNTAREHLDAAGAMFAAHGGARCNIASNCGGAISNPATVHITQSTIAGNSAAPTCFTAPAGGGVWTESISGFPAASTTLVNSIVASNTTGADCGGTTAVTSNGHNLSSDASCALAAAGDQTGTDPLLGPVTYICMVLAAWKWPIRRWIVGLFALRTVGQFAFFVTQNELMFLYFPNFLEPLFLASATILHFNRSDAWGRLSRYRWLYGSIIVVYKMQDEILTHYLNFDRSDAIRRLFGG